MPQSSRALFIKQALLLWITGVIGGAAVMPYAFSLQAKLIEPALKATGMSLSTLALISIAQTAVLLLLTTLVGLWASRKIGLHAPISRALIEKTSVPALRKSAWLAFWLGLVLGALIVILDLLLMPLMPEALRQLGKEMLVSGAIWKGALASLYGGISEELLLRLFLMSLLVLLLRLVFRVKTESSPTSLLWAANLLAALLFGLGHLPALVGIVEITPLLLFRTLLLNMIAGVACGWLYMRRGLEFAMLAHFSADLIVHVAGPALAAAGLLPS